MARGNARAARATKAQLKAMKAAGKSGKAGKTVRGRRIYPVEPTRIELSAWLLDRINEES